MGEEEEEGDVGNGGVGKSEGLQDEDGECGIVSVGEGWRWRSGLPGCIVGHERRRIGTMDVQMALSVLRLIALSTECYFANLALHPECAAAGRLSLFLFVLGSGPVEYCWGGQHAFFADVGLKLTLQEIGRPPSHP